MNIAVIGGSGLGAALGEEAVVRSHDVDTPFGKPSSPIVETVWDGTPVFLLQRHGIGHTLNPGAVPYRANLFALKTLGVTHVLASGATGSLREDFVPGELVVCDQLIDRTRHRPATFFERAAVHVEFAEPFCPVMRRWLLAAAEKLDGNTRVHRAGTYVCMEGPAFSTAAESKMHRQLGGDLIGMTACPEAKLAREAELAYALVAMPTDFDAWKPHDPERSRESLLREIIGNLQKATAANLALMKTALADVSMLRDGGSPAHDALSLGIWSDKAKIDPAEIEKLRPLWGKYFGG